MKEDNFDEIKFKENKQGGFAMNKNYEEELENEDLQDEEDEIENDDRTDDVLTPKSWTN